MTHALARQGEYLSGTVISLKNLRTIKHGLNLVARMDAMKQFAGALHDEEPLRTPECRLLLQLYQPLDLWVLRACDNFPFHISQNY